MASPEQILSQEVIAKLRQSITDAGGVEIFAVLTREEGASVFGRVQVVCRGTEAAVPAIMGRAQPGDMTLHNHPSGTIRPSQADLRLATILGEEGIGSMIVDNEVVQCQVVVEPYVPRAPVQVSVNAVTAIFGKGGMLSQTFPSYEPRESQIRLASQIAEAFNRGTVLMAEAGTGTGKSLAYLVPALLRARDNRERVAIATKTIALQEQLVNKDIPLARQLIENAPQAALVKGRGNYVCLRKMEDLRSNQMVLFETDDGLKGEIRGLIDWVDAKGSGDKADLPFVPSKDAWEAIQSDGDMCLGAKCPFFSKSPFYNSRRDAAKAGVLVLNQALLFADLAVRAQSGNYKAAAVIPPYQHVVLDEAHNIEDVATDYFGTRVSSFSLRLTMGKLRSSGRGNRGLLPRFLVAAGLEGAIKLQTYLEDEVLPLFQELQTKAHEQIFGLADLLHGILNPEAQRSKTIWLKAQYFETEVLEPVRQEAQLLFGILSQMARLLAGIKEILGDLPDEIRDKWSGMEIELDARNLRLQSSATAIRQFAKEPDENKIQWLELKRSRLGQPEFTYYVSPLDVSAMLRESLFTPFRSIVMTSATLDLHDEFQFFAGRNGLEDFSQKPLERVIHDSPFDYAKQARLFLLKSGANPDSSGFSESLGALIYQVAQAGTGGTLVLFTSYRLLYQVATLVEAPLQALGIPVMVQGREQRSTLVERLKQTHGVLLGTDSFWEGVDLPGKAVTKVIITKLPFRQMGEPIFEARCVAIEKRGGSSFRQYSLPLALLKFKQGVGRLIRTRADSGLLIVTDNRIRTKPYGKKFLALIEEMPCFEVTAAELKQRMSRQLGESPI